MTLEGLGEDRQSDKRHSWALGKSLARPWNGIQPLK